VAGCPHRRWLRTGHTFGSLPSRIFTRIAGDISHQTIVEAAARPFVDRVAAFAHQQPPGRLPFATNIGSLVA